MARPPLPGQDDPPPWGDKLNNHILALGSEVDALAARVAALESGGSEPPPDPSLVCSPLSLSFTEGSAGGVVAVSLDRAPVATVTVTVQVTGGNTAVAPASLTFTTSTWGTAQNVTVTSTNDGTASGNRSATLSLTSPDVTDPVSIPVTVVDAGVVQTPPTNSALPVITGTATMGSVLTCSQGTWTQSPTSHTYQWKRGGTAISGETASTHTIVAADQGTTLTCTVTATNPAGSGSATAAGIAVPAPSAPANSALPAITGSTALAGVLTCSQGTWTNSPTAYAYQWNRNGTAISGQTATTHTVVTADLGTTLTCTVTATNATGSTPATSAGTAIPDPNRQVFVMMGQSNMVGRGTGGTPSVVAPGRAYVYNHQTGAITSGITEPIPGANAGATSTNVSPVVSLVKAYTDQVAKIPVVNKSCKGNMYINEMGPGQAMYTLTVDSTNAAKAAIAAEGNTVTDVWGFWLQGESDSVGAMSETEYKTKLADLLDRLKVDCGVTKMFVLRVGYDLDNPELKVTTETIMRAQKKLTIERTDFIMLANINAQFSMTTVAPFTAPTMSADAIHYTTYGYEVEGAQAGNSLAYYVINGTKPPLEENVPELDVEEQPPTMVENRWDFTVGFEDVVGDKDFLVTGTDYTRDSTGVKIPNSGVANTTIALAESLSLDAAKDWAVEFEVTLDTVTTVTSAVGTPWGNRTGGIKDCIWFGIAGDNTLSLIGTNGTYQPSPPIAVPSATTRYKFVFVASTATLYLVVNDVLVPTSVPHSGIVKLRYLFSGYDTNTAYNFKGKIKNLAVRYDCNHKVELPAIEPAVLANFSFDETGIVNHEPTANSLIVVAGREAGHTFEADGIRLLGGQASGFTFANSILLSLTAKWVVTWRSHWMGPNSTEMGAGYNSSDGMLLADNTSYDWCYNGLFKTTVGAGSLNKGQPFYQQKRTFVISHDPGRAMPLKYEIDGVKEWEGPATAAWSIKRFGAGYNVMKYGYPGKVEYLYIAVNTTDLPGLRIEDTRAITDARFEEPWR